jgi:hypothetical protein
MHGGWHFYMSAFIAVLFFLLTPGVLLRLPPGGSRMVVAATHAVVFAVLLHYTHKAVWNYFYGPRY